MVAITAQTLADEIRRQKALSQSIAADQTAVSTGIRLTKASQDPLAWVQVSDLARQQAQQAAWTTNVGYAQGRAAKADSNLEEMNSLFSRAQELMIQASTASLDVSGRAAITTELENIRIVVSELVNETDFQGTPVFDDGQATAIPVSRGINLQVVATRQQISEGIDVSGTAMSLDAILAAAITTVSTSGNPDAALNGIRKGLDHIINEQAAQGVRGDRLETAKDRLVDIDLTLSERRSALESTDLTETLANVQAKLTTLEAAQAVFAKINQQTLFDLIR
ncbi:flagellin [Sphingobium algorifonticola]|uniref:Flagellin n=1 Tax=Sphingobium algorifonticola TaxID=2008318 RepID=A0A437JBT2_9SPHN|nr:flagellin [Sphingobium algorifonticola]RVT43359.1 flagellin [Sphingobium algorifonticola]